MLQSCLKTRERPEISKFHGGGRGGRSATVAFGARPYSGFLKGGWLVSDPPLHYTEREGKSKRKEIDGPSLQVFPFAFSLSLNLVFPEEFIKYLIAFMIILSDVTRSIHLIVPLFFHFFPPVPNESAVALQSQ